MKKISILLAFFSFWALVGVAQAISLPFGATAKPNLSPAQTISINPQPEPPKVVPGAVETREISLPSNPKERAELNPQPEPPAPVDISKNANTIKTNTEVGKINKNVKLERGGLDPQPEPPAEIGDVSKLKVVEGRIITPAEAKGINPQPEPPMPDPDSKSIPEQVKITAGLEVQGTKIIITSSTTGSTTELKLKTALPAFYNQLTRVLRKQKASSTIESFNLKVEDGKPVYEIQTTEQAKLLGFIPLKIKTKAIVAADTDKVRQVIRPWYGNFATVIDWSKIKLLPNLKISQVTVTAQNGSPFVPGQLAKINVEVTNDGYNYLFISPPILSGAPIMEFYVDGGRIGVYVPVMFLKPGETAAFDYNSSEIKCGSQIKVTAALIPDFPEEVTKDDNTAVTTVSCSQ